MILHVLMGQRKCNYEGEYGPEALEIMDEYAYSDNGEWLHEKYKYYTETKEFTNLMIMDVRVDGNAIARALCPPNPHLRGEIVAENGVKYSREGQMEQLLKDITSKFDLNDELTTRLLKLTN